MTQPPQTATQRAFIALAPPDDAKNELAHALSPAYAAYPDLRWNRIEDWHITLAFLGEQPVQADQRLRSRLADLAAARPSRTDTARWRTLRRASAVDRHPGRS